jgi:hypothetical protein
MLRAIAAAMLASIVAACIPGDDSGYVEIRTVPTSASAPVLFLDAERLGPVRSGNAVLKQRVGTMKLQGEAPGGQLAVLCDVVIQKDRITTVTLSVLERPPRCQCRNARTTDGARSRACIS